MYEIDVSASATDSREFGIIKDAVLDRYRRLSRHAPREDAQYRRDAPPREVAASAYTPIITSHTQVVTSAFRSELFASGFALVRPTLEALLKQSMVGAYEGDDDGWKRIVGSRLRITRKSLKELATSRGWPDLSTLWVGLSPWLNDFVHGGHGQLLSNSTQSREPTYPADWFWTAMFVSTVAMLATSAWFWAHVGHDERWQPILDDMRSEDWGTLTIGRNGQIVRIIGPRR
ncbi:MAG: hypothetical protein F4Y45_15060 [Acidobacteria bacterium]|nr:hypothetical protein [Acidobacteriota bacterium]